MKRFPLKIKLFSNLKLNDNIQNLKFDHLYTYYNMSRDIVVQQINSTNYFPLHFSAQSIARNSLHLISLINVLKKWLKRRKCDKADQYVIYKENMKYDFCMIMILPTKSFFSKGAKISDTFSSFSLERSNLLDSTTQNKALIKSATCCSKSGTGSVSP